DYVAGKIQPCPQPAEGVSYAPKIKKTDGQIDWNQPASMIRNRIRGLVPWPGAFTHLQDQLEAPASLPASSGLLKIWQADVMGLSGPPGVILQADNTGIIVGCGDSALRIQTLQREGGRRLAAADFLAGHPLRLGQ